MANFGCLKKIIARGACYSGILALFSFMAGRQHKVTILMYHRIVDDEKEFDRNVLSASVQNFERQMEYLSSNCTVISAEEFLDDQKKGKKPDKNSVMITFDDGYIDNYTNAYPILKKYRLPFLISLTSGHIGQGELFWWDKVAYLLNKTDVSQVHIAGLGNLSLKNRSKAIRTLQQHLKAISHNEKISLIENIEKRLKIDVPSRKELFMSWEQVREMSQNKIEFGAHTISHPILAKMDLNLAKHEILGSKNKIEKEIGSKVSIFTYPNGRKQDMSRELDDFMKKEGFSLVLSTIYGSNDPKKKDYVLRRVAIEHDDDMLFFRIKLCGLGAVLAPIYSLFFE